MKVFQLALRSCASLGFGPHQSTARKYPINRKNVKVISILFVPLTFSCAYFFLEASTFEEFATSVELSVTLFLGVAVFLIFIWKHQQVCDLVRNIEIIIDDSELDFDALNSISIIIQTLFVISGLRHPASVGNYVVINWKNGRKSFILFICGSYLIFA